MSGYYLWVVVATFLILLQGYFFPALSTVVPSMLAICLLISAMQLAPSLVFRLALWLGLVLDVASMHPFGTYMFLSVSTTVIIYWLLSKGVKGDNLASILILLSPVLLWQFAVLLLSQGVMALLDINFVALLVQLLGYIIITVLFAWGLAGRVQLRV